MKLNWLNFRLTTQSTAMLDFFCFMRHMNRHESCLVNDRERERERASELKGKASSQIDKFSIFLLHLRRIWVYQCLKDLSLDFVKLKTFFFYFFVPLRTENFCRLRKLRNRSSQIKNFIRSCHRNWPKYRRAIQNNNKCWKICCQHDKTIPKSLFIFIFFSGELN